MAPRGYEKYLPSEDNRFLDEAFGDGWEIVREPGIDPAFERANPGDSFGLQQQRPPGAGRFVGSRAVEDDVATIGEFIELLRRNGHRGPPEITY